MEESVKHQVINLRGLPTPVCPICESDLLKVMVSFDENYEICFYFLDAECAACGTLLTAPTPLDNHMEA